MCAVYYAEGNGRKRPLQAMGTLDDDTTSRGMMLSVLEEDEVSEQPPAKHSRPSDAGKPSKVASEEFVQC